MKETPLDFDLLILNRIASLYSAKRFQEEIKRLKLKAQLISPEDLEHQLSQIRTSDHGSESTGPAILYRQGDYNFWSTQKFLSNLNLNIINDPKSFLCARDKWTTYLKWQEIGIPTPKTFSLYDLMVNSESETELNADFCNKVFRIIHSHLDIPFILKKKISSQGRGTFLITSDEDLEQTISSDLRESPFTNSDEIQYFLTDKIPRRAPHFLQRWIVQECISESLGQDVRNFYILGQHLSIERKNSSSYLSNLHQGGMAFKTQLSKEEMELCELAHFSSALTYSGIDFLRTSQGPLFLEINPSPGFSGIEKEYKFNVAEALLRLLT